jgi:hypothetical protein
VSEAIEGFFAGDDLDIQRDITGVNPIDPLVKAWLTVKATRAAADPGLVQKVITTTLTPSGQIGQDGSAAQGNGIASVFFPLSKTDTALLGPFTTYWYDIQVLTASGYLYTAVVGRLEFARGVTDATS